MNTTNPPGASLEHLYAVVERLQCDDELSTLRIPIPSAIISAAW